MRGKGGLKREIGIGAEMRKCESVSYSSKTAGSSKASGSSSHGEGVIDSIWVC